MKKCLYSKCGKEFEPLKPKAKFCSAKCRVYSNREKKPLTNKSKKVDPQKENTTPISKKEEISQFWKQRQAIKLGLK